MTCDNYKFLQLERLLLTSETPDESEFSEVENDAICQVCIGSYVDALQSDSFQAALQCDHIRCTAIADYYKKNIENFLKNGKENEQVVVLSIGISCLQLFTQNNFCGPFIGPDPKSVLPKLYQYDRTDNYEESALDEIVLDMESVYNLVQYPEFLIIAKVIFFDLGHLLPCCASLDWWVARCGLVHQKVGDEYSPSIYKTICKSDDNPRSPVKLLIEGHRDLSALYHMEMGHFHLFYQHVGPAKKHLEEAKAILGLEFSLTGSLGKRTKWQQEAIPQLVLKVNYTETAISGDILPHSTLLPSDLPKDILLNDDTRLNTPKFLDVDEDNVPNLRPIEQMCLLSHLVFIRKSQQLDEQMVEVTKCYLISLLQYPNCWSLHFSALFLRCKTEYTEMRAMQRSLEQLEELDSALKREDPSRHQRLTLIHSSLLLPHWDVNQELARMLMRMGCVKTALEIFEKLHLWDDVIICYNELEMRQRSAKIIRQLLEKEETPKLLCLLGDATDDVEHYNKAWELSKNKSSRAQRCLGNFYYVRKQFTKAIEHYEMSLNINTLQFVVWQRLAFCALQVEDWEICAKAYRRCTFLEPESFECWNNLSQSYLKLNQPHRAWKTLQEALKCKSDSWKLWDNFMVISTSLGYTSQALHAYKQILLHKEKHVDTEILGRAVRTIVDKKQDPDGRDLRFQHKNCIELLAKLAREVPSNSELWFLYAELLWDSPTKSDESKHTAMQYYRKAVATEIQRAGWDKTTDKCLLVLMKCLKLGEIVLELLGQSSIVTSTERESILMLYRNCISSIKRSQISFETGEINDKLKSPFESLEQQMSELEHPPSIGKQC